MKHGINIYGNIKNCIRAFCWMQTVTNSANQYLQPANITQQQQNKTKNSRFNPQKTGDFCQSASHLKQESGTNHYISGLTGNPRDLWLWKSAAMAFVVEAQLLSCHASAVAGWRLIWLIWLMKEWPVAWGNPFGCFRKKRYPKMDGLQWKTLFKWMIWGYHYSWKHPFVFFVRCSLVSLMSLVVLFKVQ